MHIRFEYASKSALPTLLPQLFSLLYANMNEIAPTGNTYEQDYAHWHASVAPAMQKPQRQIALMYDGAHPCGYFQYYVNATTFMMEEIQIEKPYQGSGIFSSFFSWLLAQLPDEIEAVEAYALKQNQKSQEILQHLGLSLIEESPNDRCFHFRGAYRTLRDRYQGG